MKGHAANQSVVQKNDIRAFLLHPFFSFYDFSIAQFLVPMRIKNHLFCMEKNLFLRACLHPALPHVCEPFLSDPAEKQKSARMMGRL